jgi:RNA polymerase sigma-70 factor, ECF subfamily
MGTADDRFEELLRYYPALRAFLAQLGFSADEAADLAQETYIRVFQHLDEYRAEAKWSYLQIVARRIAVNHIRSLHTTKRSGTQVFIDDPEDPEAAKVYSIADPRDPSNDLLTKEMTALQRRRLAAAMDDLPSGARQALKLFLAGFTYQEIATLLKVTVDSVKSRLKDARRLIKLHTEREEASENGTDGGSAGSQ